MSVEKELTVWMGKTFQHVLRWESLPYLYRAITAMPQATPVRFTVTGHDLIEGWRAAVISVKGPTQLNAKASPPTDTDFHRATVVDPNTVEFNDVNAAEYQAYVSGGFLQYLTPVDLTGYTARMQIKNKVGGTVLVELTSANGGLVIDNLTKTISILISATDTAALAKGKGTYELEAVSAAGVVTPLMHGKVIITPEVTT